MKPPSRRSFCIGAGSVFGLIALGADLHFGSQAFASEGIVRPPGGQALERLEALCLRCGKCRSACPEVCVVDTTLEEEPFGTRIPRLNFRRGYCTFCNECIEECPTGALTSFHPLVDKMGIAVVDESECLAYMSGGCSVCVEACDYDALSLNDAGHPIVDDALCNGCGKCEYVCPSATLRSYSGSGQRGIEVVGVTT